MSRLAVTRLGNDYGITTPERLADFDPGWFDRVAWEANGARRHTSTGRAPVLICEMAGQSWVLRHYSRGGLVARFVEDHYVWRGLEYTRAWRELDILAQMREWKLPVPQPVAALVGRSGLIYRADIITVFIPETQALSALLRNDSVSDSLWRRIGEVLGAFHARGIDHPDITAHNILVDSNERVFLVDFDNALIRRAGNWRMRGFARFQRSLRKVALETGGTFSPGEWQAVVEGYEAIGQA